MRRKIILIKQELLLRVYELNPSGLLAANEKIRPILAQLEKLLLCDLSQIGQASCRARVYISVVPPSLNNQRTVRPAQCAAPMLLVTDNASMPAPDCHAC